MKMRISISRLFTFVLCGLLTGACSDQFSGMLFKTQYPHQRYEQQLRNAGLAENLLYRQWYQAAVQSLLDPTAISIPHQEEAFIAGGNPGAIGYLFNARQGERLQVVTEVQTADSAQLFIDLFEAQQDTSAEHRHLISADTGASTLTWDIRKNTNYILRIQPELLADVSFKLQLIVEPTLGNPVAASAKQHIGSFFGDARDGGGRQHEGIDIFAPRHTPVVAVSDGVVSRVGDNRLGGKVVWLRLKDQPINLYYAHLDSQLAVSGQMVRKGDTLGLMGNTGNALTTPTHLHFGIYSAGGAVDPLPFVRSAKTNPPKISANMAFIGDTLRTRASVPGIASYTPLRVEAASQNGFRVILPDKRKLFIPQEKVVAITTPLRTLRLGQPKALFVYPDTLAAQKMKLSEGEKINVVAEYGDFLLVQGRGDRGGWITR